MPSTSVAGAASLLTLALLSSPALANSADYAARDPLCAQMAAPRTDAVGEIAKDEEGIYFRQPIPAIIHHIWFGSPVYFEDERSTRWQQLAETYGYAYHLWTESDDFYLRELMGEELFAYMDRLRQERRYDAASDICRYALLEHMGGIYLDLDVAAPEDNGELVDLRSIVALEGLIVATERQVREVDNSAFYSRNDIIMSSVHHPVLRRMVDSLLPNRDAFAAAGGNWDRGAQFWTGQIMWNMTINGPFSVLPLTYMRQFHIYWEARPDKAEYLAKRYHMRCLQPGGGAVRSVHTASY